MRNSDLLSMGFKVEPIAKINLKRNKNKNKSKKIQPQTVLTTQQIYNCLPRPQHLRMLQSFSFQNVEGRMSPIGRKFGQMVMKNKKSTMQQKIQKKRSQQNVVNGQQQAKQGCGIQIQQDFRSRLRKAILGIRASNQIANKRQQQQMRQSQMVDQTNEKESSKQKAKNTKKQNKKTTKKPTPFLVVEPSQNQLQEESNFQIQIKRPFQQQNQKFIQQHTQDKIPGQIRSTRSQKQLPSPKRHNPDKVLHQRQRLVAQLASLSQLSRSQHMNQDMMKQIGLKREAIRQYMSLLRFEEEGLGNIENQKMKKRLFGIIFEKQLVYKTGVNSIVGGQSNITHDENQPVSKRKAQKLRKTKINTQNYKNGMQLQYKKINPKNVLKGKNKKQIVSDSPPASSIASSSQQSNPSNQQGYQQLLIQKLPARNPQTKHQYNSTNNKQLKFWPQITKQRFYFINNLLSFNPRLNTLKQISISHPFVQEMLRSTQNCRGIVMPPSPLTPRVKLRRNFQLANKKVLILDLDQTLVHSQPLGAIPDKTRFPFSFQFQGTTRHYSIRRHAIDLIKSMSTKFYVMVFTSAAQGYADKIIQSLDPQQKYIQHRLYRGHCYLKDINCPYIKDLRILNRDLSQVIIVDNSLYAYWFQVDNGIPISSFVGDQDDQLMRLEEYLVRLEGVDDVREVNRRLFHMHLYQEGKDSREVIEQYCKIMNQQRNNL